MKKITYKQYLQKKQENENIVLLDVRRLEEYEIKHLPNSVLFSLDKLEEFVQDYFPDKHQTFVIYCRSGVRSVYAIHIMKKLGYTSLYDLGGIISIT